MDKKRVVVTGMGVISPVGIGLNPFWQSLISGKSGIDTITRFNTDNFSTRIAGEVKDFKPESYIEKKSLKDWTGLHSLLFPQLRWHWRIPG